ncbi:hypothetical protein [Pseudomonas fluorescens]|jgi:hypothetical protein|uniref:hypothetical protein n=1 Tax=Pseudomonas fluorescens TaxID=294 RepID=UPI0020C538B7|nr:hypothetical protein [Pseudomonas fluorescens]UTL92439.1 hypothetical protein NLL86_06810 [Pseudomonas fluorescens]
MNTPLVTTSHQFCQNGQGHFFAVVPGVSCSEAFNLASANLSSAEDLLGQLVQIEESCHLAFAVRALVSQAKALLDSGVVAVERAEDPIPQFGGKEISA